MNALHSVHCTHIYSCTRTYRTNTFTISIENMYISLHKYAEEEKNNENKIQRQQKCECQNGYEKKKTQSWRNSPDIFFSPFGFLFVLFLFISLHAIYVLVASFTLFWLLFTLSDWKEGGRGIEMHNFVLKMNIICFVVVVVVAVARCCYCDNNLTWKSFKICWVDFMKITYYGFTTYNVCQITKC